MFSRVPQTTGLFAVKKAPVKRGFSQLPLTEPLPNLQTPKDVPLTPAELKSTTLSNGVKVVTVSNKQPVSSIAVLVNAGPRNETPANSGASFYLRRMGFKSTKNLSALRLVRTVELVGGNYEVGVTRENLIYASQVPTDQAGEVVSILSEVVQPSLKEYEVNEEQHNIQEDIEQFESNPRQMAIELLHQTAYRNKTLGQSLYTPSYNLHNLDNKTLAEFVQNHYTADNLTVVATGGVEHKDFVELVEQHFSSAKKGSSKPAPAKYVGGELRLAGDFDTHVALGFEGVSATDKDVHALGVLQFLLGSGVSNTAEPAIGHGVSGRLSKNIAEQHNFVQEVTAFNYNYTDSGVFGVVGVASKGNTAALVNAIAKELKGLTSEVSAEELNRAKALYKAQVVFNTDSRASLAEFVAKQAARGKAVFPSEFAKGVDSVSAADVAAAAKRVLHSKPSLVVLGDVYDAPTLEEVHANFK